MKAGYQIILERLHASFAELERAIDNARQSLLAKEVPRVEILERLASYDSILARQRELAADLKRFLVAEDWLEVSRHVGLINALSAFIRDDAQSVLNLAHNRDQPGGCADDASDETLLC